VSRGAGILRVWEKRGRDARATMGAHGRQGGGWSRHASVGAHDNVPPVRDARSVACVSRWPYTGILWRGSLARGLQKSGRGRPRHDGRAWVGRPCHGWGLGYPDLVRSLGVFRELRV